MHYAVLSAIPLPQNISEAMDAVPVDDVVKFIMRKFFLTSVLNRRQESVPDLSPEGINQERWECHTQRMIADLLAPYNENSTDIAHMELDDRTDEGCKAYDQECVDCVKMPDGRIVPCTNYDFCGQYELYEGQVYRRSFGQLRHRKRTKKAKKFLALPNYPFKRLYHTFDAFMRNYWGCELQEETGRYGYYFNFNGKWDGWQIGGRWPLCFLVKDDCPSAVVGIPSAIFEETPQWNTPDGYRWVAGARKDDIVWDTMRKLYHASAVERFHQYEAWFSTGQIPDEYENRITIAEDGLVSYGDYLYHKGEDLELHLKSLGLSEQNIYQANTFAYVDADGWAEQGWGDSEHTYEEWSSMVSSFIASLPGDTLLVSVDCHT